MPVKTITIDLEAYDALKRRKREGQSFSQVIKEHFDRGKTAEDLLRVGAESAFEEATLDVLDEVVEARRKDRLRPVDL